MSWRPNLSPSKFLFLGFFYARKKKKKNLFKALNMNLSSFKSSRKEHAPPLDSASNIDHGPILEPIAVAGKHNLLFF